MTKIGLLWRAEWDPPDGHGSIVESCKLREMFRSFAALDVPAQPVVYSDEKANVVRDQLLNLDGVLVWVNPIQQGLDRTKLDAVLRDVAEEFNRYNRRPLSIDDRELQKVTISGVYSSTDPS
jgi:hypothetical protein